MADTLNRWGNAPVCETCGCSPCGCVDRRASSPAAVPEGALPPLPGHVGFGSPDAEVRITKGDLTLMLENYARAAVEADRAQRQALSAPPFAAPAGKHEADTVAEVEFLVDWLQFIGEPVGVECCGRGYGDGECCGNPVPVTVTLAELEKAMNERLNVLVAKLSASRCRAQGGVTKDNDNSRAPVSSTPTSGDVEKPACRMQGGICACRAGGSYGGCAIERGITHQSIAAPSHPSGAKAGEDA